MINHPHRVCIRENSLRVASCLIACCVLSDATILCFYESGVAKPKIKRTRDWAYANLSLARFNLAWVKGKP